MTEAKCPNCRAVQRQVIPVRVPVLMDDRRWQGRTPSALGFACTQCGVLLPLSPTSERDDAAADAKS
jgi:hypothetical protein